MKSGIYQIRNKVNGKVYVGQAQNIDVRWNSHRNELLRGVHKNKHLQSAFNKYGPDSFEWSVLERCAISDLNEREMFWIGEKDAYRKGYNLTLGGDGARGFVPSAETLEKRSASLKRAFASPAWKSAKSKQMKDAWKDEDYRKRRAKSLALAMGKDSYKKAISETTKVRWKNPKYRENYINKMKEHFNDPNWKAWNNEIHREASRRPERCAKIGAAHKKRFEDDPSQREYYSKLSSERWSNAEYKKSVSASISASMTERARPILLVETGEIFDSLVVAAREKGVKNKTSIWSCCTGKNATCYGYHWRFADETEEEWNKRRAEYFASHEKRRHYGHTPVPVICVETSVSFPSCKDAAASIGVNPSSLSACCMGKNKTCGGYHWRYADESV